MDKLVDWWSIADLGDFVQVFVLPNMRSLVKNTNEGAVSAFYEIINAEGLRDMSQEEVFPCRTQRLGAN